MSRPWTLRPDGVVLAVRATPRAKSTSIEGTWLDADARPWLEIRVAVPPSEGAANAAIIAVLAETLAVKRRDIVIASGAQSRLKRFVISGPPNALAIALENCMGAP